MNNFRNLNIWKKEEPKTPNLKGLRDVDITELNLSVRSFNCLKRAGCNTVGDILDMMDEDGNGLRRVRNLGVRSETEIRETVDSLKAQYAKRPQRSACGSDRRLVRPAKIAMDCRVEDFHLSRKALDSLHSSGILFVQDLYREDISREPGWFAVRELFDQILAKC